MTFLLSSFVFHRPKIDKEIYLLLDLPPNTNEDTAFCCSNRARKVPFDCGSLVGMYKNSIRLPKNSS